MPSSPLSSTPMVGSELEDHDCGNNKLPANPELVEDLLLHLDAYKSMEHEGLLPRVLKELADVIARPLSFFNGLEILERSCLTGSWQKLLFSRRARK